MERTYKVKIQGHIVEWRDGSFQCNNRGFLKKLREACEELTFKPFIELGLDGSTVYSGKGFNPEGSYLASFAFLQTITGGRMEFISGDRPTWEKLGYSVPEKSVT